MTLVDKKGSSDTILNNEDTIGVVVDGGKFVQI